MVIADHEWIASSQPVRASCPSSRNAMLNRYRNNGNPLSFFEAGVIFMGIAVVASQIVIALV